MRHSYLALALVLAAIAAVPALAQPTGSDADSITTRVMVNALGNGDIVICEQAHPFYKGQVRITDVDGQDIDASQLTEPFEAMAVYRGRTEQGQRRLRELRIIIRYTVNDDGRLQAVRWTPEMEDHVRSEIR